MALMSLSHLFFGFLQLIGVGIVIVFALLIVVRLGTPRRSEIIIGRRTTN
jgi:hypothetical protein